ncbi:MAG: NAD(P)-dependent oxidoreductase [Phycisphaerales bacterium]
MQRHLVIQAEELDPGAAQWLAERCELIPCAAGDPGFDDLLARAAGLVVRTYTIVNEALLERAPALRVVARAGVGLDNIDIAACRARGIQVVHTPDANTRAVVELVWAFLLDALRPRVFLTESLPMDRWRALRRELTARRQLSELTIGIVGMGRVGTAIARIAAAFNMKAIYHDLIQIDPSRCSGAEPAASLDELINASDIVTLHVDDRPTNRGLINTKNLRLLRDDAILINAARGFVIDHDALAAHLQAHPSTTAILDVHDPEPIPDSSPLLKLPNAHLSPHIGAATELAHRNMSWVVRDVWRILNNEPPEHPAPPAIAPAH